MIIILFSFFQAWSQIIPSGISNKNDQLNEDTETIQSKKVNTQIIAKLQTFYIQYLAENVEMFGSTFFNILIIEPELREYTLSLMMQFGINWEFVYFCNEKNRVINKFRIHHIHNVVCSVPDNEITFEIESDREDEPPTKYILRSENIEQISIVLSNRILESRRERKL